ncbi:MAG TPA: hypothetical protein VJ792_04540 [Candidatus Nitrosotalea sp.]|nr:hypothetical protein [Candidatus Nitrosotalea sp.]
MALGFSDVLSLAQTIGIVGSLVIAFYFSTREINHSSREFRTQVISELTEKMHRIGEIIIEHPELSKIVNQVDPPEQVFAIYILSVYSQAYNMYRRKILNEGIWSGWMQIMRNSFRDGTIGEYWKKFNVDSRFSPDFREFINNTIIAKSSV